MIRTVSLLALLALLGACSGGQPLFPEEPSGPDGPDGPDGPGTPPAVTVPTEIAGNLTNARFVAPTEDRPNGRLLVQIQSLDSTPVEVAYQRNESLDLPGYRAYSVQEDPLDRYFIGLARQSSDGSIQGAVVQDGGQFNRYFGGVDYQRITPYTPYAPSQPDRGLVSYAGTYAGLQNINVPGGGETLPVPPGTDPDLIPGQPSRVTGNVFINADFADGAVNGAITDRRNVDAGENLANVILVPTTFGEDGTFTGEAELPDQTGIGSYSGAFGGTGATAVAGGIYIQDFMDEVENEEERGIFVLGRCGLRGDAAICDDVDPAN